jgi:hypothetical protein
MKISYLVISGHGPYAANQVINQICLLPSHNFEIIVSTNYCFDDKRAICVRDSGSGSVAAINNAYKYSNGDCIIICIDDQFIPTNILDIIDFFESDSIKKNLKLQVANLSRVMGGPGKYSWNKENICKPLESHHRWILDWEINIENINRRPYNVYHFPAMMRDSIEKYMDGVIFNSSFKHHYCDHWFGYYEELINGYRECAEHGPQKIFFRENSPIHLSLITNRDDSYDHQIFKSLVELSNTNISYNHKVNL